MFLFTEHCQNTLSFHGLWVSNTMYPVLVCSINQPVFLAFSKEFLTAMTDGVFVKLQYSVGKNV